MPLLIRTGDGGRIAAWGRAVGKAVVYFWGQACAASAVPPVYAGCSWSSSGCRSWYILISFSLSLLILLPYSAYTAGYLSSLSFSTYILFCDASGCLLARTRETPERLLCYLRSTGQPYLLLERMLVYLARTA
ncbi:uncharacterized protein BO97DRAFT_187048 [Aspergillus homomorphus CBS 101889]|uniref:Uncharacterized protein n=1 Tax=Aspergillus homomorphus (strain CBS 101889) TaxID=1450537 RepID=A0A395HSK6_ASPHC|nr:hypothetical protein BO97DRAFT_187048 [Aspergillus homomorphus CBS 101889]RAL09214.1 hypothetical protein BO97DRAFT_187048 [Aspergillus homomorphus CBS 101889]